MRLIAYLGESVPWKAIFGCEHCGAVLEVEEEDLSAKNRGIAGKTFEPVLLFSCMYCGEWNDITCQVPSGIQAARFERLKKLVFSISADLGDQ